MINVLFVCLGNICRSPMAEGIMLQKVKEAGLEEQIHVESAGTAAYHIGELADKRTRKVLESNGIQLLSRAQQVKPADFTDFDYILPMDESNLQNLRRTQPSNSTAVVKLLTDYDPEKESTEVDDPYYGTMTNFEEIFVQITRCVEALLTEIQEKR